MLIVHLLISRYLAEAFSSTAYSVNVYVVPGELALRLTRFARADILAGQGPRIHCSFRRNQRKSSSTDATAVKKRRQPVKPKIEAPDVRMPTAAGPSRQLHLQEMAFAKRKRPYEYVEASEEDEEDEIDELVDDGAPEDFTHAMRMIDEAQASDAESSEDGDGENWEYSLRPSLGTSKKPRVSPLVSRGGPSQRVGKQDLDDVISLSSD